MFRPMTVLCETVEYCWASAARQSENAVSTVAIVCFMQLSRQAFLTAFSCGLLAGFHPLPTVRQINATLVLFSYILSKLFLERRHAGVGFRDPHRHEFSNRSADNPPPKSPGNEPVRVILKKILAPISPAHHMIEIGRASCRERV